MIEAMRDHYNHKRLDQAAAIAKDAAPYMHPRLATITVGNKDGETFKVEQTGAKERLLGRLDQLVARQIGPPPRQIAAPDATLELNPMNRPLNSGEIIESVAIDTPTLPEAEA